MTAPAWTATAVALNVNDGTDHVAGWQYGELFIDFRLSTTGPLPFCWMVSHIPTGLGILGLFADRRQARTIVEGLAGVADWSLVRGRNVRPPAAVQQFISLLPVQWCMAADTIAPFTTVYRAETVQ